MATGQNDDGAEASTDWLKDPRFAGTLLLDLDGWDRSDLAASMAEPISEAEFRWCLARSTFQVTGTARD